MMRIPLAVLLVLVSLNAAAAKPTRFWNLTDNTISMFVLAPAGTEKWGPDQARGDTDGTVDHDERLKIKDTPSGSYDVKFADEKGRTCIVKNITVKEGDIFSIEEKQLTDCKK